MIFSKSFRHRIYNMLHSKGIIVHKKETTPFLGKQIYATKGAFSRKHEKDDAWLYAISRNHNAILDIGCNMGQSSILMTLNTNNRIICVDPNPNALSRCAENLIFNRLSGQATFVNAFVGEEDNKEIQFFSSLYDAAGSMFASFAKTSNSIGKSHYVIQKTVDLICKECDFVPNFIKIDVEGAEGFVLKGIKGEILQHKPLLFVEMHSGPELSITENTQRVVDWCSQNHYSPYYMREHAPLKSVDHIKNRGRYHLLLIPEGGSYPEYLKSIPENAQIQVFDKK
jgi:FkbM family methyltransferase